MIEKLIKHIKQISKDLKIIISEVPDGVVKENISLKEIAIIKTVNDLTTIVNYTFDLFDFSLSILLENNDLMDDLITKSKRREITSNANVYSDLLSIYLDRDIIKDLNKVSNNRINVSGNISSIKMNLNKSKSDILAKGFVYNPLYHIGMLVEDLLFKRYKVKKEEVKLINNKILKLRMSKNGDNDAKLDKNIERYQEQVKVLEHEIKSYEEDI